VHSGRGKRDGGPPASRPVQVARIVYPVGATVNYHGYPRAIVAVTSASSTGLAAKCQQESKRGS